MINYLKKHLPPNLESAAVIRSVEEMIDLRQRVHMLISTDHPLWGILIENLKVIIPPETKNKIKDLS